MRHPLARALGSLGMRVVDVASRLDVDPKTVERWFAGRLPYPRHRAALAALTGWAESDLWPEATASAPRSETAELVRTFQHRSDVPGEVWQRLFLSARQEIAVVAYSALFLAEDAAIHRVLRQKSGQGVRVRIALGDPEGAQIIARGRDEGISEAMVARIRNAIVLFRPLAAGGVEFRLHDTVLYNSIYRADDGLLVNAHVYGRPASLAPVLQLRISVRDGMAASYAASVESVWASSRPI